MAIFEYADPDGDKLRVTRPSFPASSIDTLMFSIDDEKAVALSELDRDAVEGLRDALTGWLKPKPCTAKYLIDDHTCPGGYFDVNIHCEAGAEGHDGPHRFEVTW